jgi:frataxin-like iron-binding protein CyaY
MSDFFSPYYPPRARWYGFLFNLGGAIRRGIAFDRIRLPREMSLGGLIASLLIPGIGVYLRGPRLYGKMALAGCGLLFILFIMFLGYPIGNYAFGLLLSTHVTGFVYYCSPWLINEPFQYRIFFTIGVMLGLGLLIYMPLQTHWLLPLRVNGHTVIVEKFAPAHNIKRGDWVAYKLSGYYFSNHGGQGISDRTGLGLGLVLATASDRVEFSTNNFTVNGVPQPLRPHMPTSGNLVVPENHWFIWPNLAISGNWDVGEANISSAMLQIASVPEKQFVGKPFKRWFWRKQILP